MSTTIDQRVVEMRFDNKQFENNVQTTMSTLDRLKQKLHLKGASKGLEEVNSAAKKVDMNGLGRGVEAVSAKFSAMQVVGTTALVNLTNSAMAAGKRIVSALTIDPVKTGFQEYETQINAVQTILSNTRTKGSTIDDVNTALEELNKYADKTIYNFTEMTRNIGTFTAAGVDLDTSVNAIQGIANLAAVSGSTSQQASTAMYQLSQALSSGTVKLMDWNSVVNAGMGGEVFQNALKETARVHGVAIDSMIKEQGSFRETLSEGWLTSEILTETLQKFTLTTEGLTEAQIEQNREMLRAKGYTEDQIDAIFALGEDATNAATKVKTFTQLWDVMKESAQSGWSQTWKIIVGDFEEAKALLTPLADFATSVIGKFSDARNAVLESALGKSFTGLVDKIKGFMKPIQQSADSVKSMVKSVEEYAAVVDDIIGGKWGNGQERWDKLTEAGYDWAHAQNLVNEKLGNAKRHATNYAEAQNDVAKAQENSAKSQEEVSAATAKQIAKLAMLSEEELKAKGYTDEQIQAFRELIEVAEKTGIPLEEFIKNIDNINGRYLLINSFKNAGQGLVSVFKAMGQAWREAFHGDASDEEILNKRSEALFNLIAAVHKFSTKLVASDDTVDKLTRTFKGLFAILDLVTTVLGGGFKIAFKVVSSILGYFNMDVLDLTARVGDALVKFRDWVDSLFDVSAVLDVIVPYISKGATAVKGWITSFKNLEAVQTVINGVKNAFKEIKEIDLKSVGNDIFNGLIKGLGDGALTVIKSIMQVAKDLITKFCEIVGVHSPSTVFMAIGGFIIAGLVMGLKDGLIAVPESFQGILDKCIAVIKGVDWGSVFALGVSVAAIAFIKKVGDALSAFSAPFEGIGDILEETADVVKKFQKVVKSFSKVLNGIALNLKVKALKNLAVTIGILAGVVLAMTLLVDDPLMLWNSVAVVAALAGVLVALAWATGKMSDASIDIGKGGVNIEGLKTSLVTIGIAVLALAATVKIIGTMKPGQVIQGFLGLAGIMSAMLIFLYACRKIVSNKALKNIDTIGSLMIKLSFAMGLMVGVAKLAATLDWKDMGKAATFAAGFAVFIGVLNLVTQKSNKGINKIGGMMVKLSIALLLMVGVIKLIDLLSVEEILKGAAFAAGFVLFVKGLVKVTQIGKEKQIAKLGGLLLSISLSMALMVGVLKLVDKLTVQEILKGAAFAAGFVIFVKALVAVTSIGSDKKIAKVSMTILAMSVAIGILAGIAIILSLISIEGLVKGVTAVTILGSIMALMIHATKGATNVVGNLVAMSVAIALMAAAVAGLSFIEPKKLAGAVASMSILMLSFSAMIGMTKLSGKSSGMLKTLWSMLGVVVVLGAIVAALTFIPNPMNAIPAAAALSIMLLAMSGSMAILNTIKGTLNPSILGSMAILGLVVAEIGAILGLLAYFDITPSLETASSLSILLLSMSAACGIVSFIPAAAAAQGALGLAAFVGIMAGVIAALGGLSRIPGFNDLIADGGKTFSMIGSAIGGFVGSILGGAIAGISSGLPEIGTNLSAFMMNATPFIDGMGSIDPSIVDSAKTIAETMLILTAADLISGITSFNGIFGSNDASTFGEQLSGLASSINTFVTELGVFDESKVTSVTNVARAIKEMALAATEIPNEGGWAGKIFGENGLGQFGGQLSTLGTNLNLFVAGLGEFDEAAVEKVKLVATAIKEMALAANEIPNEGGWAAKIFGDNGITTFVGQLPLVATGLRTFASNLGDFNEDHVQTIKYAAKCISEMALAASEIDGQTGWAAKLFGDNSIATFSSQLPLVGINLRNFALNLGEFDAKTVFTINCAVKAIAAMSQAASEMDGQSEWAKKLFGDNSIATFASQLPIVGMSLRSFATNLGTFDEATVLTVKCAANAIAEMAKVSSGIDGQSEWAKKIFGDNGIAAFSSQFGTLGTNLATFAKNLGTFGEDKVVTVKYAIKAVKAFAELADADLSGAKKNLSGFGGELGGFATDISTFCGDMPGSDSVDSAVSSLRKIIKLVKDIAAVDASSVAGFTKSLNKVGKEGVDAFVKAFTNSTAKSDVKTAAKNLVDQAIKGIESKKKAVKTAFTELADAGSGALGDAYDDFYSAGSSLVDGFAAGISENSYKAAAKAAAMASAAYEAAKAELDINSPSKVFRSLGYSVPEGFAMGIDKLSGMAAKSATSMADITISGVKDSISRIADAINGDLDAQPTIRPVLDLSDVRAGANTIGSMLGFGSSLGVAANVGIINSTMNGSRSAGNSDIVSAIDKLRKDLGNIGGDSYSINGINYSDDESVANAIKTIVGAARRERRM